MPINKQVFRQDIFSFIALIAVLLFFLTCSCTFANSDNYKRISDLDDDQVKAVMSIRPKRVVEKTKKMHEIRSVVKNGFEIVIVNNSDAPLRFGRLSSALGYDQFHLIIELKDNNELLVSRRKDLSFTLDGRNPDLIPPGSFQTFDLNVDDGTWKTPSGKIPDQIEMKRIRVLYRPGECQLKNERKEKQIFDSVLKSKLITIGEEQ